METQTKKELRAYNVIGSHPTRTWQIHIYNDKNELTSIAVGETQEECESNAKKHIKYSDMHNEAMDVILGLIRAYNPDSDPDIPSVDDMVKKAMDLLNRDKE